MGKIVSERTSDLHVNVIQHREHYALALPYNERDGVSNNRVFWRKSKKTPKLRVPSLCERDSTVNGKFPAQYARNAENVPIWWRHKDRRKSNCIFIPM